MAGRPRTQERRKQESTRRDLLAGIERQDPNSLGESWQELEDLLAVGIAELKRRFELAYTNELPDLDFVRSFEAIARFVLIEKHRSQMERKQVLKLVESLGKAVNELVTDADVREAIRAQWETILIDV